MNIPFGYWRNGLKTYSLKWFLAIHIPVLLIILVRIFFHIPYELITIPLSVLCFFSGQYLGGRISRTYKKVVRHKTDNKITNDV